ncbi:hypothetical protein [Streptomyces sp. bgisy100]|uniref:hypothetical protein n=1 Tax=Streptomyces sp. bgisy100 TaxID=3413783 RepID=UPI003D718C16
MSGLVGVSAWRGAGRGLVLFPASVGRLVAGIRQSRGSLVLRGGCGVALGLFGWAVALLAGQATANGLLYPLIDAHDYEHSWGGPTLVGAWVVHALVAVPVVLAALGVLRGVSAADRALEPPAPGGRRPWWPVALAGVFAVLGVLLVNAWLHQL